jgi:hypothetical protein
VVWYLLIIGQKTCDLWLTCNWFNQNINSLLSNVEIEIKSETLNMFQLHGEILELKEYNNHCDQFVWFLKSC